MFNVDGIFLLLFWPANGCIYLKPVSIEGHTMKYKEAGILAHAYNPRMSQEDNEFKANLDSIVKIYLKNQTRKYNGKQTRLTSLIILANKE